VKLPRVPATRYLAWTHGAALLCLVSQLIRVERSRLVICGRSLPEGEGMRIRHPLFVGLVAAFAVSLASVVGAVAAETPFKGKVNAVETVEVVPPTTLSVTRVGTGTATYLGKFTERITLLVDIPTGHATGAATFTAANGDTLTATVDGQATPTTTPGVVSIVEDYTITGGTGRFADASGTFTLEGTLSQTAGVSTGTFSGVIDH
jgi:hypothetical protein